MSNVRYCIYCGEVIENRKPRQISHPSCLASMTKKNHPHRQITRTHVKGEPQICINMPRALGTILKKVAAENQLSYMAQLEEILLDHVATHPHWKELFQQEAGY